MTLLRALALVVLAVFPATAAAAGHASFGLKALGTDQGYFVLNGSPGGTVHGKLEIVNAGKVAGVADVTAVDATTGRTTGAVYGAVSASDVDISKWLTVSPATVSLAPGQKAIVRFTAHLPSDARSGDHLGGIVARPADDGKRAAAGKKGSFQVDIVEQSIVAVQITVPGPARSDLAVRGAQMGGTPGVQTLVMNLSNPGERLVRGAGSIVIADDSGSVVRKQDFAVDTFVPRTKIAYPLPLRGRPLSAGKYKATIKLRWPGGSTVARGLPVTVTSSQLQQVYGSTGRPGQRGGSGSGSGPALPLIGGAIAVLLAAMAAAAVWFRRRAAQLRALEARLAAAERGRDEEGGVRFEHDPERQESGPPPGL